MYSRGLRVLLSVEPSSTRSSQLPWVCVNTLSMASSMNLSAFKRMTTETDSLPLALFAVQNGTLMLEPPHQPPSELLSVPILHVFAG